MNVVWQALLDFLKLLAAIPVIPFLIVYFTGAIRGIERQKAFRLAMDVTTAFLIAIVAALINRRSNSNFGFYLIVLLMLIGAGLIGNAQNRLRGKVLPARIFRAVWRLSFFAMGLLYVLLMSLQLLIPPPNN